MISLLKEVGRGKRGARDLTYEEARRAAELIVTGEATQGQIGAFLAAERIKMESADEIRAFVDVLRSRSMLHPVPGSLDCAGPYDGRTKTFMATIPTAFVLASCGLPATLHGSAPLPPKWGITTQTVLHELIQQIRQAKTGDLPMTPVVNDSEEFRFSPDALIGAAQASGFLYVSSEDWCPPLASLRCIREELGLRTIFNTAEKLIRYSDSTCMVAGVFHGTVFEKLAKLVIELGIQRGLIIQGMEGSEDIPVDKSTRTYLIRNGSSSLYIIDPEYYELQAEAPEEDWTASRQAAAALGVLHGNADMHHMNAVLLNSAVRLWIGSRADSIEEGIYRAKAAIEEGAALQACLRWTHALTLHVKSL
ncbi:anthranilate phosphoribosyltransferase [Paenibacillus thalictri]|uniref:Anthranilate phosphoribosyltransferase n=1 Tax=Paenibacillus thalictri TaxID=2527873 RepID=A0A4Q9DL46_9BACL|nr:anthranilate phosphoribosyltransferase [Paenibacillus thalictri]TBL75656.1 anthranilate phosphoribosyltransferase [Paenibacillus thalictri]